MNNTECTKCPVATGTHKPAEALHQQIDEPALQALRERMQFTHARLGHAERFVEAPAAVVAEVIKLADRQRARIAELEKAESDLINQRDHCEEIIDRMADAVLGKDRPEWSSAYDFMDAAQEVEDRVAELEAVQPIDSATLHVKALAIALNRVLHPAMTSEFKQAVHELEQMRKAAAPAQQSRAMSLHDAARYALEWLDEYGGNLAHNVVHHLRQALEAPQAVQPDAPVVLGWVHRGKNGRIGNHFHTYEPHCDTAVRDDGGEKIAVIAATAAKPSASVQHLPASDTEGGEL